MDKGKLLAKGLAAGYGDTVVVDGVEIAVHRGEIVTLIGPNGAGKSTLLKTLIGVLAPLRGTVYLDGEDMRLQSGSMIAKRMAILMTGRPGAELMRCRDVVESGRYPYTGRLGILSDADHAAVRQAMEVTETLRIAEEEFSRISDGQRQRVLLARAIAQEPEVLLLDEPTSFLDLRYKLELLRLLKELARKRQLAVLLSLHELELVRMIADRVVCLCGGKVDRTGTAKEIFSGDYIKELYGITSDTDDDLLKRMGLIG